MKICLIFRWSHRVSLKLISPGVEQVAGQNLLPGVSQASDNSVMNVPLSLSLIPKPDDCFCIESCAGLFRLSA